jgi:hypothetical protein
VEILAGKLTNPKPELWLRKWFLSLKRKKQKSNILPFSV